MVPILFLICAFIIPARIFKTSDVTEAQSKEAAERTWAGYKRYFIDETGRVMRPKDGDTVSEGQAYAMLRAVWMNDKETFDRCYVWTENNLSRKRTLGDNLLAWLWKDGRVSDWMPASDADIDYALSLLFADSIWKGRPPNGVEDYGDKARKVLGDILKLETYSTTPGGWLYLSPWILNEEEKASANLPVNPSYYSPGHFRIFYLYTKDKRWLDLIDTTYYLLKSLSSHFDGRNGVGLIPDWSSVNEKDEFRPLEGRNSEFGWEAVRVPFRIAMDYFWFGSKEAKVFFKSGFSDFAEREFREKGAIFCEYAYDGTSTNRYENPLFYASYACALKVTGSAYYRNLLEKTRAYINKKGRDWIYLNKEEYYVNSLAWLIEGFNGNIIKNLAED